MASRPLPRDCHKGEHAEGQRWGTCLVLPSWGDALFARLDDYAAGKVIEALVDLPQGADFLLQLGHLDLQLLLVSHQVLREKKRKAWSIFL